MGLEYYTGANFLGGTMLGGRKKNPWNAYVARGIKEWKKANGVNKITREQFGQIVRALKQTYRH